MIKIVLVDSDEDFLNSFEDLIPDIDGVIVGLKVCPPNTFAELVIPDREAIMIIGPNVDFEKALELSREIRDSEIIAATILCGRKVTTHLLQRSMQHGVMEVLSIPSSSDELKGCIDRAVRLIRKQSPHGVSREVSDGKASVITLFSAKGGVGKSFMATNLASSITNMTGKRVVLVDLDLAFGDIAVMLTIYPQRTIYEAAEVMSRLDVDMLEGFLVKDKAVAVLPAPIEPEQAECIDNEAVKKILDLLTKMYDYVIIDTPARFNEQTFSALDISDLIILVASMDVPSIKNSKIALRVLSELRYSRNRVILVLNRANSKVGLTPKEVSRSLNLEISGTIPSDRAVPQSINQGSLVVDEFPKSAVAKSINDIAMKIVGILERNR